MPPILNDDDSAEQVRSTTRSPGASAATIRTIHQQDLDRREEQKSSAEIVRVVSPIGQSNSNRHHRHPGPNARSAASKSIIKLPRWTSKHIIPSSKRNKDHRRSKNDIVGTPPKNNLMHPSTSIKSSPRPTSDTEAIAIDTSDLLSLRPLLAPNTLAFKETTSPGPGPTTTSTNTITYSDSNLQQLRSIICLRGTNAAGLAPLSNWDVMFLKHVATPQIDQSLFPADLQEGQDWLDEQQFLHATMKNGQYHPADHFQRVQASFRLNLLELTGMKM
jgi:hypothetical protein